MGLFDRVEKKLEQAVKGPFAKAFRAEVQPVEIASAVRGAMDDRAAIVGPGRTIVPNVFTVELSTTDYQRLASYSDTLTDELIASAEEHADAQRYTPGGPVEVQLRRNEELETGVFRLRPTTVKGPRRRVAPPEARQAPRRRQAPPPQPRERRDPYDRQDPYEQRRPADQGGWDQPQSRHPAGPAGGQPYAPAAPGRPAYGAGPGDPDGGPTRPFQPPPQQQRPRPPRGPQPWLDIDGDHYRLARAITVLGRDESADVILDDPGVSRRHSEIRISNDGPHLVCSIRDLGSTNGTFVNGDHVQTHRLSDGDRITVGRTHLVFRLGGRR